MDAWYGVKDGNMQVRSMLNRHYSANHYRDGRTVRLSAGPGGKMVLLTPEGGACFIWRKFIDLGQVGGYVDKWLINNANVVESSNLLMILEEIVQDLTAYSLTAKRANATKTGNITAEIPQESGNERMLTTTGIPSPSTINTKPENSEKERTESAENATLLIQNLIEQKSEHGCKTIAITGDPIMRGGGRETNQHCLPTNGTGERAWQQGKLPPKSGSSCLKRLETNARFAEEVAILRSITLSRSPKVAHTQLKMLKSCVVHVMQEKGINPFGISCAVFRNERPDLYKSSDLILEAEQLAWDRWPGERLYTYVNPRKVKSRNPGYCFIVAGWRKCGVTKSKKLLIFEKLWEWREP